MKRFILIALFLCVAVSAQASKVITPAPSGSGTYAELDGGNTFTGEQIFESIQSDEITVARPEIITLTIDIAATTDDYTIVTGDDFRNNQNTGQVGFATDERMIGCRFTSLGIPQGATITGAQMRLTAILSAAAVTWQVGIVDSINPVNPTSFETWPAQETIYDYTHQDSGTLSILDTGVPAYFPLTDTGTVFLTAIQRLVDNPSWGASSAIQIILSDGGTPSAASRNFQTSDLSVPEAQRPKLIIKYIMPEYLPVATTTDLAPRIVLPDTIYGVVGDTLQLFKRGMIEMQDPYSLPSTTDATFSGPTVNGSYPRYFEVTPLVADVGTKDFTVTVFGNDNVELVTKTVDLVITDKDGVITPAANKNFLCLGDSLTQEGAWPTELYRRLFADNGSPTGLDKANITFVGDKDMTGTYTGTAAYTGIEGWKFSDYAGLTTIPGELITEGSHGRTKTCVGSRWTQGGNTWYMIYTDNVNDVIKFRGASGTSLPSGGGTLAFAFDAPGATCNIKTDIDYDSSEATKATPFWDEGATTPDLDFLVWQTRNISVGTLDAVYILLGWNNIQSDLSAYMNNVRTFLDKLHYDIPDCAVRIIGIQVPSTIGGLGDDYDSDDFRGEYYRMLVAANNMNIAYQDLANEIEYIDWVKFIGMMPQLDAEYNYEGSDKDVNTRNTTKELIGDNGIHPDNNGYAQIADAVFREFVATFLE